MEALQLISAMQEVPINFDSFEYEIQLKVFSRCIVNRDLCEKSSLPKWSETATENGL